LLIPTPLFRHILPALVLLRKPLSGLSKRRKQPERYVPCFRFSGYIGCTMIYSKERKKIIKKSLVGQLNAIMPHGTAVKTYKKYIFQYIIGKVAHMDAIMLQNIRRFFLYLKENRSFPCVLLCLRQDGRQMKQGKENQDRLLSPRNR
jgi:hypothetical protein